MPIENQTYKLPKAFNMAVKAALDDWRSGEKVRRLWERDATLWTGTDEGSWLGWLGITENIEERIRRLYDFAQEIRSSQFDQILLLGMGGSSLCPEVLKMTFGRLNPYPELHVLDSTVPTQVKSLEARLDLSRTLFIVSSKSGSTLEPNIFKQYFFERVNEVVGPSEVGSRFVAITDPGSKMEQVARADGFRQIFFGLPSIGGRYSALSDFGMVPAAVMGLDVRKLLERAHAMAQSCGPSLPMEGNPGVLLGLILGIGAEQGRDKITLVASPGIWDLGAWLEQLLAESTGKDGVGLIPVDRESLGLPDLYGQDRLFVYLRLASAPDSLQDKAVETLEAAGMPVVRISLSDPYDLGSEFFRWEIATAVAGAILGIHPFNQPDVEASKVETKKLTVEYEMTGSLPKENPFFKEGDFQLFADNGNATILKTLAGRDPTLRGYLRAHLKRLAKGDYFAILAYLEMNQANEKLLQTIRVLVRDKMKVATCLGFGPRFLHSTGQAYKGGPNSGVYLQLTGDDRLDLAVPGQRFTFGVVKAAQARGDFQVLAERERRAVRVHLAIDSKVGLERLVALIQEALG